MTSRRRTPEILGKKAYSCPHCGAIFPAATNEDRRGLRLHRMLHVDLRHKRMLLSNELMVDRGDRLRLVAD